MLNSIWLSLLVVLSYMHEYMLQFHLGKFHATSSQQQSLKSLVREK